MFIIVKPTYWMPSEPLFDLMLSLKSPVSQGQINFPLGFRAMNIVFASHVLS